MRLCFAVLLASFALACTSPEQPAAPDAPAPATLTASGDGIAVGPHAGEQDGTQWAASVVRVDFLNNQEGAGVKLFGTAGGDPAMNGLYTHIAFYQSTADGWRVFRIGDFLDYRVLSDAPGRVDLELNESVMNASTGDIGGQTRHVIITWEPAPDGGAPAAITVTPAQVAE